jgi:ring-1,2-phenylacetyl-CoA epoxidase subunit PaaD
MVREVSRDDVWAALATVRDPELPVLSILELGIVDRVEIEARKCTVEYTPTMTSCPATSVIARNIADAVSALGLEPNLVRRYAPPWGSSRLTESARQKLRGVGVSVAAAGDAAAGEAPHATCTACGSTDVKLDNPFGGKCCRSLMSCNRCLEHFQHFRLA